MKNDDVGVVLIFFNRPKPLEIVFSALREAKVNKLFLIQDGARLDNDNDAANIKLCRDIVSQIDWECEVHRNFSDTNLSCDHRVFTGISWAFEYVDKLIILEDDCLPSQSFFPFCKELLNRYENDNRIHMISGMNYFDKFKDSPDSYFFSNTAAGWGWATWKRTWETATEQKDFDFLKENYIKKMVSDNIKYVHLKLPFIQNFTDTVIKYREKNIKNNKVNSWEYAMGIAQILNSSLIITPTENLVSNIGLTEDSTHTVNQLNKLNKQTQKLFFKKTFEIDFPLKHPKYIIRNFDYEKRHRKLVGSNKIVLFYRKGNSIFRRLYFSNNDERINMLSKFIKKVN